MQSKTVRYLIIAVAAVCALFAGYHYIHTISDDDKVKKTTPAKKSTKKTSQNDDKTAKGMDLAAIKSGDFRSVVGTWKNPAGDTFVFDKNGLVSLTSNGETRSDREVFLASVDSIPAASIDKGMLKTFIGPKDHNVGPSGAVSTYFIPANVKLDGTSNPSVDRIYSGQQMDDHNIFTKVD
ncbi:DUF6287 domain-containing protein [Fructobacillus sp. W13]|uniref:DUF6287 domain-containing protein n=1 Tax=Fructobacillus apis TaxID=2935017 RepID=A0ABT0ZRG8_9LACO|nr:DUF6287 domain-containing protein [Fructobacillus apis]MCO0832586.1 DUF6287 domain-containing protein [Fructobacillus apis]